MKRSRLILWVAATAGALLFGGSYLASRQACQMCLAAPADNLAWLQMEFHLSNDEMVKIRAQHEAYRPHCAAMCARIAAKRDELKQLQAAGSLDEAGIQKRLRELTAMQAECRDQMYRHFVSVSQFMPGEQGRRYLEVMRQFTYGTNPPPETVAIPAGRHESQP